MGLIYCDTNDSSSGNSNVALLVRQIVHVIKSININVSNSSLENNAYQYSIKKSRSVPS